MTVLAATEWNTNGNMIADCHALGYIKESDKVLDATYGRGIWWSQWEPPLLTAHTGNFLDIPYDTVFDVATYDPPYVSPGGRKTSTMDDFNDRYGLHDTPSSPAELQAVINEGLTYVSSKVKQRGLVLVKCMDYVSSGKLWIGTHYTLTHALDSLNMELLDRLEHIGRARPQPSGRQQVHARRNLSTLFVLRNPK